MPEADVVYSDVKFIRAKENAKGTVSSPDETTYSEVNILKTKPAEQPVSQPEVTDRRSKVTDRVPLLVLCALLAAAVIGLGLVSFNNFQTNKNLQTLKDEHEAMRKNFTEKLSEIKSCTTVQPTCPKPTEVKMNDSCSKCEEGWELHGGRCYYFSIIKSSWNKSRDECKGRGGDLVKIDSREEQSFLENKLREKMEEDEDKFWIGLTDAKEEGKWLWVDDSPLNISLTFWSHNEPDNWTGNNPDGEDCARMGEKGGATDLKCWFDRSCKADQRPICEKPADTGRVTCVKSR